VAGFAFFEVFLACFDVTSEGRSGGHQGARSEEREKFHG